MRDGRRISPDIATELTEDPEAAKAELARIPRGQEVVVVCTAGEAAVRAADYLRELGYDAKTLACHRP